MTANAAPSIRRMLEIAVAPVSAKNAAIRLSAVASKPGPSPPKPAEISTDGTKYRKIVSSWKMGASNARAASASATAVGATP